MTYSRWRGLIPVILLAALALSSAGARAADAPVSGHPEGTGDRRTATAPVVVDGDVLFRVRGVSAYPAEERARQIAERIRAAAADPSVASSAPSIVPGDGSSDIVLGTHHIVSVLDADAALEGGVRREEIARAYAARIRTAVELYRHDRTWQSRLGGAAAAVVATAILIALLLLRRAAARRVDLGLERRFRTRIQSLAEQSFQIVQTERVFATARATLRAFWMVVGLVLIYLYLSYVLSRFPGTRPTAARLLGYILRPFAIMGGALLEYVPNLIFLLVLVVVARYVLKVMALLAAGVERGSISLQGFDREWAVPTYRITRIAVIGLAAVVAYPYIPGSESAAFKGLSIFFGVLFSLGASSVVANAMAGYSLIYRRTFKVGDRVKINDVIGDVAEMRLQVTHLRTIKNEDVIVPNSSILSSQVVNYTSYAASAGLILHTTVGIGYEVPWRQVEAMLLMAAGRTPGLMTAPPAFVLQTSLGDFAVNYELNVYCADAHAMASLYTALHRNIQDVFNEYGVQIMTPAYESDPSSPKVVPKDHWHDAPAPMPAAPPKDS